ncbi:sugar-phosphatase [Streptosporangium becharense]|uniref:Sugar-phosphatase n=1 Tax=Streptosporangium becharense TaxID=1816182 RepID=A0A7W9IEL4_9ACTN|nr:HAD family phosphatase [Streptosporangium becharense]MBB2909742.1 sugar-phosphatase [Streptosporangium becharense]MBB5819302.1 sugar-phosphatase [Streptosporangium becharense]
MDAAALFDLDGTLINTERRSLAMWAMLLEAHGIVHDEAELRAFMGRRGRDVLAEKAHLFPGREIEDLITQVFSFNDHPDLPDIVPVPGAAELVRRVAAHGSPVAVVTSAGRDWAEERLTEVGVRDLVDTLVTAQDVTVGKPHPEGFLLAAARLSVDPAHCVAFEDSIAGIAAAKAAGMSCVGIATTHTDAELTGADLVVADLTGVDWPLSTRQ